MYSSIASEGTSSIPLFLCPQKLQKNLKKIKKDHKKIFCKGLHKRFYKIMDKKQKQAERTGKNQLLHSG